MTLPTMLQNRETPSDLRVSRARFLRCLGGAAAAWMVAWPELILATEKDGNLRERMSRIIREYDSQGNHRTGSTVDEVSGQWLADEVRVLGLDPILEQMPFSKIDIGAAYLEINGHWFEGIPLFDGGFSDQKGVTGSIGGFDGVADIGMERLSPIEGEKLLLHRRETRQRALIIATGGDPSGEREMVRQMPDGLVLFNAESYKVPFGPPVLQVPTQIWPQLKAASARGAEARVVAHVTRRTVRVFNVTTEIKGTNPALAPLVIMTPRSGWWSCASERGGGIAIWLEMLRSLKEARPARPVFFVASTGHELGHYGLDHYLSTRHALIGQAIAWIHLGANFGASVAPSIILQASDDELQTLAVDAMKAAGKEPAEIARVGNRPRGEAKNIYDGRGRYISILGHNGLFHHPHDRWPVAVDVDAVSRLAQAFVNIGTELTRG